MIGQKSNAARFAEKLANTQVHTMKNFEEFAVWLLAIKDTDLRKKLLLPRDAANMADYVNQISKGVSDSFAEMFETGGRTAAEGKQAAAEILSTRGYQQLFYAVWRNKATIFALDAVNRDSDFYMGEEPHPDQPASFAIYSLLTE